MTAPDRARFLERGAIAQLVERVLCKHEVVGSIPSGSTTPNIPRDRENKFLGRLLVRRVDIVNEGSVRTRKRWPGQT